MKLSLRTLNLDSSDSIAAYAERRVRSAIGRFIPTSSEVRMTLMDANGPKGGVDKVCAMHVVVRSGFSLSAHVSAASSDAYAAIDIACERLFQALHRRVERRRERSRAA
jgi:ribosome-associated translation inhibitor RaiA